MSKRRAHTNWREHRERDRIPRATSAQRRRLRTLTRLAGRSLPEDLNLRTASSLIDELEEELDLKPKTIAPAVRFFDRSQRDA